LGEPVQTHVARGIPRLEWQELFLHCSPIDVCPFLDQLLCLVDSLEPMLPIGVFSCSQQHAALSFLFHFFQPGAHIWLVFLVEMSEEQAAADLHFFQSEDAPQILELLLGKSIEGLY
jgi:hypothetical protein